MGNINKGENYVLKHKNINVISFQYEGKVTSYDVLNENHIPLSIKEELTENAISRWIEKRLIPVNRDGYDELIEKIQAVESEEKRSIVLENKALSLSDCYWITNNVNERWEDENFFINDFDDEMAITFLESPKIIKHKFKLSKTPTLSLDGEMPKAWIIGQNNERVLLKRSIRSKKNVVNEIIVSKILDLLDIKHITYNYLDYKEKLCCACQCFCNENTDFITAEKFTMEDNSKDIISSLDFYINKCKENGIEDVEEKINEMLTIDYLVGNWDRHWKNFGVMRGAETLKIMDLAPIFDNDKAFDYISDNSYMVSGMNVDRLKNIIKKNKITELENFEEILKPMIDIDAKGVYNIEELYVEICRRYKILTNEVNSARRLL